MTRVTVLWFVVSCGAPQRGTLVLTPDDDVAELAAEAVGTVNFIANATLLGVGPGGTRVRRGEVPLACGSHLGKEIVVSRCSEAADLSHDVLVHEIGHALGLGHSEYRGSIMAPVMQQMPLEEAARCLVSALW